MLFVAFHEAVSVKDDDGRLPLYYAVTNNATLKHIKVLYEAEPVAVNEKNNTEELPLSSVVQRNAAHDLIKMICEAYAESIKEEDHHGFTLLHFALHAQQSMDCCCCH
jgi:ankyrin repeat protein